MGWALPGCNSNCPSNWINDGYCDKACNTPECDFDGGDCDRTKNQTNNVYDNARISFANQSQEIFPGFYCSVGCSTSWLADKYCDNACNNKNCGYDLGDCGLANFKDIYRIDLDEASDKEMLFELPTETTLFYVNFTNLFANKSEFNIIKAEYEENDLVRKMSIINKFRIMTVILMPNAYSTNVTNKIDHVLKIKIQLKHSNDEINLNKLKLAIQLNAFLKKDVKEITKENSSVKKLNKFSSNHSSNTILSSNLSPKILEANILMDDTNLTRLLPENVEFSNKIFKNVYESYYNYLNWSYAQEFISQDGFYYKLNRFFIELNTKINETYNEMIENSDTQEMEDDLMTKLFLSNNTVKDILLNEYLNSFSNESKKEDFIFKFKKRKILDTFADSLRYVNRLFNQIYGYMARKVPAHMPHYIDREIMSNLQEKFQLEFDKTSSNRLRSASDMQYSFTYYYYVISELENFDPSRVFDEMDLNMNNYLDETELIIASLKLSNAPFSSNKFSQHEISAADMFKINKDLKELINDCKENQTVSLESESHGGEEDKR
jgi:UDP-N-acetylglucosamine-lysosomal-enzyme